MAKHTNDYPSLTSQLYTIYASVVRLFVFSHIDSYLRVNVYIQYVCDSVLVCVCVCLFMFVCVCVCVWGGIED